MKKSDFSKAISGRLVETVEGLTAFVPADLPPKLNYSDDLLNAVTAAASNCSALSVAAERLGSDFLINGVMGTFLKKEAQLSSKIEGTHTTLMNVLLFEQDTARTVEPDDDTEEVLNYIQAQNEGLDRLRNEPVSLRLLRDLHATLLRGVRGRNKAPGQFRRHQVHLGALGGNPHEARYVPPPPNQLLAGLDNLEKFINAEDNLHPLLRTGLTHYQFEAIHPFGDGNGRIGRLLIILLLCNLKVVERPLVYPSAFFERNRQEYYDRLLRVSTHGDWSGWLVFFLKGIAIQAREALERCQALSSLHTEYLQRFQKKHQPAQLLRLVDLLFKNPLVTARGVERELKCSPQTANGYISRLCEVGILVQLDDRQRNRRFYAKELFDIIDA